MVGGTLLEKGIHHYLLEILNNFPMLELCVNSPEALDHYFDILEETLDQNDFSSKPCQMNNCDETVCH